MSVFAKGPSATEVDVAGIAEAMRPALEMWMTARVKIFDPARANSAGSDPFAPDGSGPNLTLVLDSGVNGAIVQPIRSPTRVQVGDQPNAILGIRFQVKRGVALEAGQSLRGGLLVHVISGGNDDQLAGRTFALQEGVDSSLAWDRILDAVVVTGGY